MTETLCCDHVQFYVTDVGSSANELADRYGFVRLGGARPVVDRFPPVDTVVLGQGAAVLALTQPRPGSLGEVFLDRHGEGVARIGFRCRDVRTVYARAVAHGATVIEPPRAVGSTVTAVLRGVGDLVHTLVQQPDDSPNVLLPGIAEIPRGRFPTGTGLLGIDHFALCVPAGELPTAVEHYRRAWGFDQIHQETIEVGALAMNSTVVASPGRGVVFTFVEPAGGQSGQINQFLRDNSGPGVQHIAFLAEDIVASVGELARRGVRFAATPTTYYAQLSERLGATRHPTARLAQLGILADRDHGGQLYQIFTRSTHRRRTYFVEIIERDGATGFGTNNIRALFAAKQRELDNARHAQSA
jgi:4-hydroxymandelate synthase